MGFKEFIQHLGEKKREKKELARQIEDRVRIEEMIEAKKPIGALCIAPVAIALALGSKKTEVTIGNDAGTAAAIETMGGIHIQCGVGDIHVDKKNNLVTTPAYMLGPGIKDVAVGIEKLISKVLELAAD